MTYGHSCSGCGNYSSSAGSYNSSGPSYSGLESVVSSYQGQGNYSGGSPYNISESQTESYVINLDSAVPMIYENRTEERAGYQSKETEKQYISTAMSGMIFTPAPFLKKNRPYTMFVGQAYEIQDFIKDAFRVTTNKELPEVCCEIEGCHQFTRRLQENEQRVAGGCPLRGRNVATGKQTSAESMATRAERREARVSQQTDFPKDIIIEICSKERLREIHESFGGRWSNNIQGFAINKKHIGEDSLVFIASGPLDKVMLTIGHEIGHVMSAPLADKRAEEAKAFAFSLAWMKAIKESNIAGLADSIELDEPARNGLHNVALEFVLDMVKSGRKAFDIFNGLASSRILFDTA